jgi:anti-sigma regulatory factor (Ser/Thr protein kinase)/anti-anti-sigma regulatory factor
LHRYRAGHVIAEQRIETPYAEGANVPSQLVCRPELDLPVAVLKVSGTLDALTGDALAQAVRNSLSKQPESLLLDIAELEIIDPRGLAALGVVVGQTAQWPAVPIVLCGADADTARAIAASPGGAWLQTAESCVKALAAAGDEPEPRRIRVRLRPVPDACRQVRQVVTQACAAWQQKELTATAALIATELVANVVRHAHTTMEFTLGLRNGRLCVTVRDGSRHLPQAGDPDTADAGGRGLHLVRALTDSWGVLPTTDGKVVWTQFGTRVAV